MSLVLLRGKADSAHNNPCFMTSPSEFTTFEFLISNYFNFQIFVRSRREPKEKLPGRVPTITEATKKFYKRPRPLFRPRTNQTCQQKSNPSRETVSSLIKKFTFISFAHCLFSSGNLCISHFLPCAWS